MVSLSKFNIRVAKKIDKILKIDVTKNVCICDALREKEDFMQFIISRNLKVMDGMWLFRYLIPYIAKFIGQKIDFLPETRRDSFASR